MKKLLTCLLTTFMFAGMAPETFSQLPMHDLFPPGYHENERKERLAKLEERIRKSPKDASVYFERGQLYDAWGNYTEADKDYSKTISLEPKHRAALLARAQLRSRQQQVEAALEDYKAAFMLTPEVWIKGEMGRLYLAAGDYASAADSYTTAIDLGRQERGVPEIMYLQQRASIRHSHIKDFKGAVEDYEELVKINPANSSWWNLKAHIKLEELKDYKGAVEDFTEVLKYSPAADAYYFRGKAKYKMHDVDEAFDDLLKAGAKGFGSTGYGTDKEFYDQLVSERQVDARAYFMRGLFKMNGRGWSEAMEDLDAALKLKPGYAEVWFFKGYILLEGEHEPSKALEAFKKAEELGYRNAELYFNRAKAKMMQLDDKGALKELDKAIKIKPMHGNSWRLRIDIKKKLGDSEGVESDFQTLNTMVSQHGYNKVYEIEYF